MYPQLYWYNPKENFFLFAAGKAPEGEWTISFRDFFHKKRKGTLWDSFPLEDSFSPQFVVTKKGSLPTLKRGSAPLIHTPNQILWEKTIDQALTLIDQEVLQKVVLARMTTVQGCPVLGAPAPLGISFALLLDENHIFLGNTPETLFQKRGKILLTEALAGTKRLGVPAEEFLQNPKERQEFFFVRDTILEKLSPYCSKISYSKEPTIKRTATLQHLWTPIEAHLAKDLPDHFLVNLLHPTPAVGGLPHKQALDFIYDNEPFDRGLYAAPIGIKKGDFSHFIVAIRSALFTEKKMHLFAGTGIIASSHPNLEWEELDAKISR